MRMPPKPKPIIVSVYGSDDVRARHAEFRRQTRQHDGDRVHAGAADGHQQQRNREPRPRVGRFDARAASSMRIHFEVPNLS